MVGCPTGYCRNPQRKGVNRGRESSDNQWGEGHGQDRGGKEGQGRRDLAQSHTRESRDSDRP